MATRIQVGGGPEAPKLRPGTSPVDTFVQPKAGSQLGKVAQALAALQPSLSRFGDVIEDKQNKEDRAKGAAEAHRLSLEHEVKSYKEAIDKGLIKPSQSPIFRRSVQETFGRIVGNRYGAQLLVELAQSDVSDSDNPADFDKFEAEFRKKYMESFSGDEDPDLMASFNAQAEAQAQGVRSQFAQGAAQRVERNAFEGLAQEVMQAVLDGGENAVPTVEALMAEKILTGANKRRVNQTVAQAVIDGARRLGGDPLLAQNFLDKIKAGTGKLSMVPEVAKALEQARQQIAQDNYAEDERAHATETRDRQERVRAVFSEVTTLLDSAADPTAVDVRELAKKANDILPGQGEVVFQLHDAYVRRELDDDPQARKDAFLAVHGLDPNRPGRFLGAQGAANLLAARKITVETYRSLLADIDARDNGGEQNAFTRDSLLNQSRGEIFSLFASEFGFEAPETRMRASIARDELTARYIGIVSSHPGMSETDKRKVLQDLKTEIFPSVMSEKGVPSLRNRAATTPLLLDWNSGSVVAEPGILGALEREHSERRAGKRGRFSPAIEALLADYAITPDLVDDFIAVQKGFNR